MEKGGGGGWVGKGRVGNGVVKGKRWEDWVWEKGRLENWGVGEGELTVEIELWMLFEKRIRSTGG
jgi:hypothetical protein